MHFALTEEQAAIQETALSFAKERIAPHAAEWDETGHFPIDTIRETAALYVMVMAVFAWLEGERREAAGWAAALLVFALVLAAHAYAVAGVTGPLDPVSAGWAGLQGFGLFVKSVSLATALTLAPLWLAALLVGLSLFGWASWNDALALRVVTVFATSIRD